MYNKLTRDFEKPFALDGVTRIEDTPVHKAVREALANCIVNQCQLVKNFENRISGLNIGMKCHLGADSETDSMNHAICRTVFLFYCMTNKQV